MELMMDTNQLHLVTNFRQRIKKYHNNNECYYYDFIILSTKIEKNMPYIIIYNSKIIKHTAMNDLMKLIAGDPKFIEICETNILNLSESSSANELQKIFLKILEEENIVLAKIIHKYLKTVNFGNSNNKESANPLIRMSYLGKLDSVKFLIENGADINIVSENGTTAIMYAFQNGHIDIVKYLLDKGAATKTEKTKMTNYAPTPILLDVNTQKYLILIDYLLDKIKSLEETIGFNKW